jgi:chromosome partitioning protein
MHELKGAMMTLAQHLSRERSMPVITFANTKGGAGKTTALLIFASELVRRGQRVTIVDADPRGWISRWNDISPADPLLTVCYDVDEALIEPVVTKARKRSDYVLIDLASSHDAVLAKAVGLADHVLIPVQGCAMDAAGGAEVLDLLNELQTRCNVEISHSVVLSRVNAAVTTRALQAARTFLQSRSIPVMETPIVERAAYRDVFDKGGFLHTLSESDVSNLSKAIDNGRMLTDEMLKLLPQKKAKTRATAKQAVTRKAA